jgi:hypothetical protein
MGHDLKTTSVTSAHAVRAAHGVPGKATLVEKHAAGGSAAPDTGATHQPPTIHRSASGKPASGDPQSAFAAATAGAATELPHRAEMQQLFGADFSSVRAHVGQADALTALGAEAATRDETIAFGQSTPDRETVAHELTHVMQHRQGGGSGGAAVSDPSDASEHEARSVASAVTSGGRVAVAAAPAAAIHRQDVGQPRITVDDANRQALAAGFDPLFPTARLPTLTTAALAEGFLTETIAAYFTATAAADHKDHQAEQAGRTARAVGAFMSAFNAQQLPDEAARVAAAAKAYNDRTRGGAVEVAFDAYRNMPVTIPGRGIVHFTVPYNRNVAEDAGGPTGEDGGLGQGKLSAAAIKDWIHKRLPPEKYFLNYIRDRVRPENPELNTKTAPLAGYSEDQLSRALAGFCRQNKIGVDCNGLTWNVIDAADRMLGGDGLDRIEGVSNAEVGEIAGPKFSAEVTDLAQLVPGDTLCWGDPTLFPGTELAHHIMVIIRVASSATGLSLYLGHSNELRSLAHDNPDNDLPAFTGVAGGTLLIPAAQIAAYAAAKDGEARKQVTGTWDWSGVENMGTMETARDLTGFWHVNWSTATEGKAALGNAGFATAQSTPG